MNQHVVAWLPTDPPRPCPEILTAEEAAIYLRLDLGAANPKNTLAEYRSTGRLRAVQIGRDLRYRIEDLRSFTENQ